MYFVEREDYNRIRPHGALGNRTPSEFARPGAAVPRLGGGMQAARMIVGPRYPVVGMSWDVAVEFCKTLSEKTGRTVRLPMEAEREDACRAGTTTRYPCGDDPDHAQIGDHAWYDENCEHQPPRQSKPI